MAKVEPIKESAASEPRQDTSKAEATPLENAINETLKHRSESVRVREYEFAFQQRRAGLYAASGMFGKTDMPAEMAIAQAMVRIDLGEAMGFTAAESLMGISVVSNRPCIEASLRSARMQSAGYGWDIQWHWDGKPEASNCVGCTLWLRLNGKIMLDRDGDPVRVSYMKADAEKMLTTMYEGNQKKRVSILEKDNWKMNPRNMYFARCVTNAQRWHAPAVLSANLLSRDEAEETDEPAGRVATELAPQPKDSARADALRDKVRDKAAVVNGHDATGPITAEQVEKAAAEQAKLVPSHVKELTAALDKAGPTAFFKILGSSGYDRISAVPADAVPGIIAELQQAGAFDQPGKERAAK